MEAYTEFVDPTSCALSVPCQFTSSTARNLVVSKGTVLQLFDITEIAPDTEEEYGTNVAGDDEFLGEGVSYHDKSYKLVLVGEYHLQGRITDITTFRSNESHDVDYLIVCTESVRVSIVKWDASSHTLRTNSLHYYEPSLQAVLVTNLENALKIHRTDPNGWCTSFFIEGLFAFLPFFRDDLQDAELDKPKKKRKRKRDEPEPVANATKYFEPSFILPAIKLKDDLKNILDYQYLHAYRNPTIAVLYGPETLSWAGYLPRAKDNLKVSVLSLDLNNHKASSIMELANLPYDLDSIYPLPSPINGFLLLGANEIIHVNSLGSIKGVYVNNFYPETSDLKLKDMSHLDLTLEHSRVSFVGDGQVLLITESGQFGVLGFDEAGGISNLSRLTMIDSKRYTGVSVNNVLSITNIEDRNSAFLACQGSDSILLHWKYTPDEKVKEVVETKGDDEDDSWLYEPDANSQATSHRPLTGCTFTVLDSLVNVGPTSDFTIGRITTAPKVFGLPNPNYNEKAIVCTSGLEKDSALSIINPTIKPEIKSTLKFSSASKVWTMDDATDRTRYIITTDAKAIKTQIFQVDNNYKDLLSEEFDNTQFTVQFGTVKGKDDLFVVQVTPFKVNLFSFDFKLVTSVEYEREINAATIHGNYVIAIMKNGELDIYECHPDSKELEKLDLPALLNYQIFTYAWIADSSILNHVAPESKPAKPVEEIPTNEITFWIVTADNRLLVFKKDHKEKVFEFKNIHNFPGMLQLSSMDPNYEADVDPVIKQVMFTTLGDKYHEREYLVILTFGGEVLIYEFFFDSANGTYKLSKANGLFEFPIVGAPDNAYADATKVERNLFKIDNLSSFKSVLVTGSTPFAILAQHNSVPRMMKFAALPALHFAPFNGAKCKHGVLATDDKKSCRISRLDTSWEYSNKVPIKKVPLGGTANQIEYESTSGTFLVSTFEDVPYKAVDEDGEPLGGLDPAKKPATTYKGTVKLITPANWSVIDKVELEDGEICNSLKVMPLRVFETMNLRKNIVVIVTGKYRVEDLVANGSWKAYEVIDIVPELGHPEAKNRLKKLTEETSKGAGLGACAISGRFSVIQGQRLLVRMIKRDGNTAPVAFTDTSVYSKDVKSFEDLVVVGDAYDGVSLYGFDAEPYRMIKLSKDSHRFPLTACDFIEHEGNLFVVAADENSVMHLFQYDPYDPDSMRGMKLLRKSVFRFNNYATAMKMLNRRRTVFSMVDTLHIASAVDLGFEIVGSNIDGSFFKVSPLNEYQYRRLYSLQNYVTDKETHWLGLNPRLNAIGNMQELMSSVRRPFIDLRMIKRYLSMKETKKEHVAKKLGHSALVEAYKDAIALQ